MKLNLIPFKPLLLIFFVLLFFLSNAARNEDDEKELLDNSGEDNVVLLNYDGETVSDNIQKSPATHDITEKDLEPAEYSHQVQPFQPQEDIFFEEFVQESPRPGNVDPRAEALYKNALEVLSRRRRTEYDEKDVRSAFIDLEEAANLNHPDAQKVLAFSLLFGEYRWSIDEARQIFERLAASGSPDAHLGLGFMHTTGIGFSEANPAKGLLHYTFSALGGNPFAQMSLGYRYAFGISVPESCEKSLQWYKKVAEKVASKVSFIGGPTIQRLRIPDEVDATSSSSSLLDTNVFTYYKYLAETGDMQAILGLALLYLTGGKGVPIDHEAAAKYFMIAAESGNIQANAYLGKMYLEGTIATPQDNTTAFQYFKKAADKGNALGQAGLGIMFLYGRGVQPDPSKALKLFTLAAEQGWVDGQFYLGLMHYKGLGVRRDFKLALKYFQLASQSGNLLAIYNLAQMHAKGFGVARNCRLAMELFKNVAERGKWAERLMDAYQKWQQGAVDEAAFRYLFLGEIGYEVAQTNFAYLVDRDDSSLFDTKEETEKRALLNWQRAANQDYPYARVKLGDYNYYGQGTQVDYTAAANHYKIAAERHQNAQAMFNLGYMHEKGLGVNKDLHLAKRFYDLAAETSTDAFVPVALALLKLRMIFFVEYFKASWTIQNSLLHMLDVMLGPDWDLYLMSLAFGIIIWLAYGYFRNRQNQHHRD
uniref:Uncharacterized protein n=1 Tax=Acrobeloides nanus TaxID=290746 RepID=A0A914CZK7_9BILA